MSALSLLPTNFSYVALVGASVFWLNVYQMENAGMRRKAAKVPYPFLYADKAQCDSNPAAMKFNCAQRAHANTLEAQPTFLLGLVYSGLYYPKLSAALGAIWVVGRVLYTIGYSSGVPERRNTWGGISHNIGYLGLMLTSTWLAATKVYALL